MIVGAWGYSHKEFTPTTEFGYMEYCLKRARDGEEIGIVNPQQAASFSALLGCLEAATHKITVADIYVIEDEHPGNLAIAIRILQPSGTDLKTRFRVDQQGEIFRDKKPGDNSIRNRDINLGNPTSPYFNFAYVDQMPLNELT